MKPYEWMVKPTPQTEWIEKRGKLLWLAFFFIELGAGTFFVASFFGNLFAMILGLLICGVLGCGFHVAYLGKPLRAIRMFSKVQTSWISRGIIFVTAFLILGFVAIVLSLLHTPSSTVLVVADIFAFLSIIYGGFAMSCVNGIPLWNSALIPILYVVSGIWGGTGLMLGTAVALGLVETGAKVEHWAHGFALSFAMLLIIYLMTLSFNGTVAAKKSAWEFIKGRGAYIFWVVTVILGLVIPLILALFDIRSAVASLIYLTIFFELIGDLGMRYLLLKHAYYNPLITTSAAQEWREA
jgi:formate-dependent nitrite reductase membrane component NrfD